MNIFSSFFLILLLSFSWAGNRKTVLPSPDIHHPSTSSYEEENQYCRMSNETFQDGEELTYRVYYNLNFIWLNAGTVTFKIRKKGDKYFATAVGETRGSYDWFFKVRDTFHSVLDANTLLPLSSTRIVNEGSYTKYDQVKYLRNSRLAESTMGKTKAQAETSMIDIDQCVHDVLSSIYAMRNTPIETLESREFFKIDMLLDRKKYPVSLYYIGSEENKKIKGIGDVDVDLFEPTLIAGNIFKEGNKMKIWVSKDRNKIPLLIESPISVGHVKAVLTDHKKLKYKASGY